MVWGIWIACFAIETAGAQARQDSAAYGQRWSVAPFIGHARQSPVGNSWGQVPDRNHVFFGLHLTVPIMRRGGMTLEYAPNVIPLVILSDNPRYRVSTNPDTSIRYVIVEGTGPVRGRGFSPIGLQGTVRLARGVEAYGGTAAGALWFSRNVPVPAARRFNFTIEWGGGLAIQARRGLAAQVGYKFHHLSNANTAPVNYGVDANLFYAGMRWSFDPPFSGGATAAEP